MRIPGKTVRISKEGYENTREGYENTREGYEITREGYENTREGYENLAVAIDNTLVTRKKITVETSKEGTSGKKGTFFWRGFISPVGSAWPRFSATSYKANKRARLRPYRGGNDRGRRN
jgi:hypothetical protein